MAGLQLTSSVHFKHTRLHSTVLFGTFVVAYTCLHSCITVYTVYTSELHFCELGVRTLFIKNKPYICRINVPPRKPALPTAVLLPIINIICQYMT